MWEKALRNQLDSVHRVIIKCGTSVVSHKNGIIALGRVAYIVEQIVTLLMDGKQVLVVSSGAVSVGKQKLRTAQLQKPLTNRRRGQGGFKDPFDLPQSPAADSRACAAAGQSGLINLYEVMFGQYGVQCAQVLVTDDDFSSDQRRENLRKTLDQLMSVGIVPILNENDVISQRSTPLVDNQNRIFWDNDSLAGLIATETSSDLLIILSDIDGLFRKDPTKYPGQTPIPTVVVDQKDAIEVEFGEKSRVGRGGMEAKLSAVYKTVRGGVPFVAIANGYQPHTITRVLQGEIIGTLFTSKPIVNKISGSKNMVEWTKEETAKSIEDEQLRLLAKNARNSSRLIRNFSPKDRATLLESIANAIRSNQPKILEINAFDIESFTEQNKNNPETNVLLQRLKLTPSKLNSVVDGLLSLSKRLKEGKDPLSEVLSRTEVSAGLELLQTRSPIGVLFVIFEARPEVLPQVIGLSLASGNSVILKGGKEASKTNHFLFDIIHKAIEAAFLSILSQSESRFFSNQEEAKLFVEGLAGIISTREEVSSLLKIGQEENLIDLIIPRGSNQLVQTIKASTKIPVLGHADGICNIFIHQSCDINKALRVIIDSKTDYPAACNACECILIPADLFVNGTANLIINELIKHKVQIFTGPRANSYLNKKYPLASSLSHEYGDLKVTIELVDDVKQAIELINENGSAHTDCIIAEDLEAANLFMNLVDSACVFWNCSTRFSDGYRFGLGAEVGISTNRIHARGPVGLEGLTITKWKLASSLPQGHCVADFSETNPNRSLYTHKPLSKL